MKQTIVIEMSHDDLQTLVIDSVNACIKNLRVREDSVLRNDPDRYIGKREASKIASVSTSTIDNWGRDGKLTRHYFGGCVRFWLPELMAFLEAQRVA